MTTIAIVDYGAGNLHSVARALQYAAPDANVKISQTAQQIASADRVVFPGQGAMPDCMGCLTQSGLHEAVLSAAKTKPLLGICVGEQMLFEHSDEGACLGLGIFEGNVKRFSGKAFEGPERLKVPQIGWNKVSQSQGHALWHDVPDSAYFYFVHSYYVQPQDEALVVGQSLYGYSFACAVARDNIFATQFHPEKSAQSGLQVLRNFVHWNP